jgi:hypothetical protein
MPPTVQQLTQAHATHKAKSARWDLLTRLIEGGDSITLNDKQNLLKHPDNRPDSLKQKRAEVAHFSALLGGLVIKLQSQVMRSPGVYEPFLSGTQQVSDDPIWGQFIQRATYGGESLHECLSLALQHGLSTGMGYLQVDTIPTPQARNRAEQREMGGDRPFVIVRPRSAVLDWDVDQWGYKFAKIHTTELVRDGWDSTPTHVHRYQIYRRTPDGRITSQEWRTIPKEAGSQTSEPGENDHVEAISEEQDIFHIITPNGPRFHFPLIPLKVAPSLAVGPQLFEVYSQFFTQTAAINYATLVSLWRQLIFENATDDAQITKAIGMGAGDGFWWALPPGVKALWLETDTAGLEFALKYRDTLKAEMYDQISQIAISAAASYQGISRSGESKKEDRRAADILLETYGNAVRTAAQGVLDCAAIARGELIDWAIQGFNKYDSDGLLDDIAEFTAANPIIGSPTFDREGRKAIAAGAITALGLHPNLIGAIAGEIDQVNEVEENQGIE